jgi:hypothetical protein
LNIEDEVIEEDGMGRSSGIIWSTNLARPPNRPNASPPKIAASRRLCAATSGGWLPELRLIEGKY